MKKSLFTLLAVVAGVVLTGLSGHLLWAQEPCISVKLNFDAVNYSFGQPVGAECVVSNDCGKDIWVNKGFSSKICYLEMLAINPAGNQLTATHPAHQEFPDAPPLAFIPDPNNPNNDPNMALQVTPCELLPKGWSVSMRTSNLGDYYHMKLSGTYSFQVQLSEMIFKTAIIDDAGNALCDVSDFDSLGVSKSNTQFISTEGTTEIHIVPNQWNISWLQGQGTPNVVVQIKPEAGKTIRNLRMETISMNNLVAPKTFEGLPSGMLKIYFDPKAAISSLGPVDQLVVGNWYPVTIWGQLEDGNFFAGSQKVRIQQ